MLLSDSVNGYSLYSSVHVTCLLLVCHNETCALQHGHTMCCIIMCCMMIMLAACIRASAICEFHCHTMSRFVTCSIL
jgi:hypothetical protein